MPKLLHFRRSTVCQVQSHLNSMLFHIISQMQHPPSNCECYHISMPIHSEIVTTFPVILVCVGGWGGSRYRFLDVSDSSHESGGKIYNRLNSDYPKSSPVNIQKVNLNTLSYTSIW